MSDQEHLDAVIAANYDRIAENIQRGEEQLVSGEELSTLTSQPINVWYADGVRHEDYRQDDGSIKTVEVRPQCLGCGGVKTDDHKCQRNKNPRPKE